MKTNDKIIHKNISQTKLIKYMLKLPSSALNQFQKVTSLSQITNLYICRKNVHQLPQLQQVPHLKILWLNSNRIQEIGNKFDDLKELQQLYLNSNQIKSLHAFSQCKKLKKLNLAYNCIKEIQPSLILPTSLKTLLLSKNNIETVQYLSHIELPNLQILYLSGNLLSSAHTLRRLQCPNLKTIFLDSNKIVDFTDYDDIKINKEGSLHLVNLQQTLDDKNVTLFKIALIKNARARYKGFQVKVI